MSLKLLNGIKSLIPGFFSNKQNSKNLNTQQEIELLTNALQTKAGSIFYCMLNEVAEKIKKEKDDLLQNLQKMNGDYYQDPKSILKMKWDILTDAVNSTALGRSIERREQLEEIYEGLAILSKVSKVAKETLTAQSAIEDYKDEEKKRDHCQQRLNEIICMEKASENFTQRLLDYKKIRQRAYGELCGQYFGDPNGELDKAWQKFQKAEIENSPNKDSLLKEYQNLDEDRKKIEAQLYFVDQYLSLDSTHSETYEMMVQQFIENKISQLTAPLKEQKNDVELDTILT